jgi:hypothetical protein
MDHFRFTIDIESLQNRLLKVCYVPASSAGFPFLSFLFLLLRPLTVLMKQTRHPRAVYILQMSMRFTEKKFVYSNQTVELTRGCNELDNKKVL